ncbi:hypothetical protein [Streptomyces chartreusis]|uniref:hypothetical protein n=1 Tax=Streptomyces chartreusis TaxID=1969 RepID=UPI0037DCE405|nr:hypothetical protein OG938_48410 [Streptomyces chartreusis]
MTIRNVYLDCEFLRSDPELSGLYSIALTDDNGIDYYACNKDGRPFQLAYEEWMLDNVVPYLPMQIYRDLTGGVSTVHWDERHPDYGMVKPAVQIRDEIAAYFENTDADQTHLYAYYGGQDIFRLHSLWGHDWSVMPDAVPCWFYDLKGLAVQRGNPRLPEQQEGAHNALEDARWNREVHRFLQRHTRGRAFSVAPVAGS